MSSFMKLWEVKTLVQVPWKSKRRSRDLNLCLFHPEFLTSKLCLFASGCSQTVLTALLMNGSHFLTWVRAVWIPARYRMSAFSWYQTSNDYEVLAESFVKGTLTTIHRMSSTVDCSLAILFVHSNETLKSRMYSFTYWLHREDRKKWHI